ncbi:MAG: D-alanine--D-alanine ligase [Deltaproteobacteria bacterium]|nr:D-alanine--D-alanine ligase [Deltaproteobacteria bacterium]
MTGKLRLAVIFGGRSAEHEVSLQSAKHIIEAIDRSHYHIVPIFIDKKGKWHILRGLCFDEGVSGDIPGQVVGELAIMPGERTHQLINTSNQKKIEKIDVAFPVLHGPYGEDGTVQGLLKLTHIPFVGAGVTGSAIGMDKDVMKRVLRDAGIPVADFLVYHEGDAGHIAFDRVTEILGPVLFVKPANLGSSVGISKVAAREDFSDALATAFKYDHKIIIEECIEGREIECAVLGNEKPVASVPGELSPRQDFYSYEAKYIDEDGADFKIPADLAEKTTRNIQELAVRSFDVLCCEGMARVDFFLDKQGKVFVNELNTIPGFTAISMYPKLWEASGMSYSRLIDRLIDLALERHEKEQTLKTSWSDKSL